MPPRQDSEEDTLGSLEHAREALYSPHSSVRDRASFRPPEEHALPHAWEDTGLPHEGKKHVRLATIFLGVSFIFFLIALGVASYLFYFGSSSVSTDKIDVSIQGPITIAGGDTVPLLITITNKNPVAIQNATIEVDFPDGTRSATDILSPYTHYVENLGTLASGATVTRSIKAVVFGGAGQTLTLPVSLSYGMPSSNAVFEKKLSYALSVSYTPLSVSVDALSETVSGTPMTFTVTVRSNATIPLDNVVLSATSPIGFSLTSSSIPSSNSNFYIGTLAPGAVKKIVLTGVLSGQDNEQRVFHFTVGTAASAQDQTLAVTYMTQDATVSIASPFITTTLAINGDTSGNTVLTQGSSQSVSLSYTNTLPTTVMNAAVSIAITGSAVDYNSIRTTSGFYDSVHHSILFSKDTDQSLASLAPGASGIGSFTFSTLPAGVASPTVTFTTTVSGTRVGQTNVPEQITSSLVRTAKVGTAVSLSALSSRAGPFESTGPIPPRAGAATTYAILWNVSNTGNAVAGGVVTAVLPSYVSYTGKTSGTGSFSYDTASRTVTWNVGDLTETAQAQGAFQVSLTPSTSQKGASVSLTSGASFSGYDRFAGATVTATANPVTTETRTDAGYIPADALVQ